jgi:hypothetical protein
MDNRHFLNICKLLCRFKQIAISRYFLYRKKFGSSFCVDYMKKIILRNQPAWCSERQWENRTFQLSSLTNHWTSSENRNQNSLVTQMNKDRKQNKMITLKTPEVLEAMATWEFRQCWWLYKLLWSILWKLSICMSLKIFISFDPITLLNGNVLRKKS